MLRKQRSNGFVYRVCQNSKFLKSIVNISSFLKRNKPLLNYISPTTWAQPVRIARPSARNLQ